MSTIYSAGQYDDAFSPKKLGNWEAGAKDILFKPKPFYLGTVTPTAIIADSRGHLLPWVPRDKSKAWGMLNSCTGTGYESRIRRSVNDQEPNVNNRKWKLPRFQRKKEASYGPEPDHVLEYLQSLSLPIIWIIGPPTKNTIQKRKQFSKQLAATLGFSYVNLDEKIVEWKERQTICTCAGTTACSHSSFRSGTTAHSLASTSIAPSKLPTNVQPLLSSNMPSTQSSRPESCNSNASHIQSILESQRISFDTALPIERNKIMELYKFAMVEGLPCGGFVMDTVPHDLVEGIAFEKMFYPAALAIYFTEGTPQSKNKGKLNERRVTAISNAASTAGAGDIGQQKILSPIELLKKVRKEENIFLRMRHHKRLGFFSPTEGEKICRQYGNKTIRIINAEDVENETMEFLNELVKRNLEKYPLIMDGKAKLDVGGSGDSFFNRTSCAHATLRSFNSEEDEEVVIVDESTDLDEGVLIITPRSTSRQLRKNERKEDEEIKSAVPPPSTMPPALVAATAQASECSVFTIPNIFHDERETKNSSSSATSSPNLLSPRTCQREAVVSTQVFDKGGAGDIKKENSDQLWEKIIKLESKVAEVNPEDAKANNSTVDQNLNYLPPPTAYAHDEDEKLTAAIRNAMPMLSEYVPSPPVEFDYGAGGDCGPLPLQNVEEDNKNEYYSFYQHRSPSRSKSNLQVASSKTSIGTGQQPEQTNQDTTTEDPFYDS
ncbi:unnamed protein product [Orchesella dallaii]|uniref:Cilia- and flagella-associated protein 126 n=1 Tax=Orchesella dallaii TaxID=48710 RepID=A0ABP1QR84_9HEXA